MNFASILELFDEERRCLVDPGWVRETSGSVVRHVSRYSTESLIAFSAHRPEDLSRAISGEIEYFRSLGHDFEWKTYAHDRPKELVERLRESGFSVGPPEVVVVAGVSDVLAQLSDCRFEVSRLTDPDRLDEFLVVSSQIWGAETGSRMAEAMRDSADSIGVYVAYCDGVPVGCSRSNFHAESVFSGLWGGGVLPAYRRRGVYRSMVGKRARDAEAHGATFLRVDALPTSRPILEKLGFQRLSETRPCVWCSAKDRGSSEEE